MSKLQILKTKMKFPTQSFENAQIFNADCFELMHNLEDNSIQGVVTDPPYGVREYLDHELQKLESGKGGIWRIPPSFDGNVRSPLPRFTALDAKDREAISDFFEAWSSLACKKLAPGAHVFIASNSFIAPLVYQALINGGLEFRGQIIRLVRTLRGGDRPKNAEEEFPYVSSMPRGCYEPWGIFRKTLPKGMKVSECLREFKTGGLRRSVEGKPFEDIIQSERTPQKERKIANHPSIKPQSLLRKLVYGVLPLGEGIVLDPFMGSGSTIAAAESLGIKSIGIERYEDYYQMAVNAIPKLSELEITENDEKRLSLIPSIEKELDSSQLAFL